MGIAGPTALASAGLFRRKSMSLVDALHLVLFVTISVSCVSAWRLIFSRLLASREIIPYQPRASVPWHLLDVVAIFLAATALIMLCAGAISAADAAWSGSTEPADAQESTVELDPFFLIMATSLGNLLAFGAACAWLKSRRATNQDLGFDFRQPWHDLRLGAGAFAAASIPIFLLQWALSYLVEPSHAVSDIFKSDSGGGVLWATAFFAVIVAPVAEEFLFRVVLQGWLESFYDADAAELLAEDRAAEQLVPEARGPAEGPSELDAGVPVDLHAESSPAAAPPEIAPMNVSAGPHLPPAPRRSHMPVLISSFIFGAVHFEAMPSPIPLFFFALALGYVYRQTHRLLPSVVAHMCLNALSTVVLATGAGQ
jgi:membrane protease YdiL (CAAX protease family)